MCLPSYGLLNLPIIHKPHVFFFYLFSSQEPAPLAPASSAEPAVKPPVTVSPPSQAAKPSVEDLEKELELDLENVNIEDIEAVVR